MVATHLSHVFSEIVHLITARWRHDRMTFPTVHYPFPPTKCLFRDDPSRSPHTCRPRMSFRRLRPVPSSLPFLSFNPSDTREYLGALPFLSPRPPSFPASFSPYVLAVLLLVGNQISVRSRFRPYSLNAPPLYFSEPPPF